MQQPFLRIPRNVSGRDFAVGDVHGHFSRLRQSLDRLGFDPTRDRLFSVGDLVDRGPENEQVLDWLRQPWFHAVQGNHEDYAIRHVRSGKVDQMNWRGYGGGWFLDLPEERQREYAQAFEALPVAIEVETRDGAAGARGLPGAVLAAPGRGCATATSAPARSASGRVTACAWWIAPACSACARGGRAYARGRAAVAGQRLSH